MMISYAQNFEDVLLKRCLGDIEHGFYVDVGAHHPELDSVTKWFYDLGWSGINVEPVPHLHRLMQEARPRDTNLCLAAGATAGRGILQMFPESPGLSTLNPVIARHANQQAQPLDVELRPLREILEPIGERAIHFLKIDVEGAERDVLLGMDFERFRPWVLVIESAPPDGHGPSGEPWEDLVLPAGYRMAWFDGLNRFYLAEEHLDRLPRLAQPPHVFDHFELAATRRERAGREAAEAALADAQREIGRTDAELAAQRQVVAMRDNELAALQADKAAIEADKAAIENALAEHRSALAGRDEETAKLRRIVAERDKDLATLRAAIAAAEAEITAQQNELAFQGEVIKLSDKHIMAARRQAEEERLAAEAYLRSTSWRATAPLRAARRLLRRD